MATDDLDPMAGDDGEEDAAAGETCCCKTDSSCCKTIFESEVNADDMALVAMLSGIASMFLSSHFSLPLRLVGLACGALGLVGGYVAQKGSKRREKQAIAGMVCGTIGLVFWLLLQAAPEMLSHLPW